ncbi:MAG: hypothetical protein V1787_05850 [Candidatus Micrarchaeota archaeon]
MAERKIRVHIGCWDYGARSYNNKLTFEGMVRRLGLGERFEFTNSHTRGYTGPFEGDHNEADYLVGMDRGCAAYLNKARIKPLDESRIFALDEWRNKWLEPKRLDEMKRRVQQRRVEIIRAILKAEGIRLKRGRKA